MRIIARLALYLYDGSAEAPLCPAKADAPSDAPAQYLSALADKLMLSDGTRTTRLQSADEELLRRFTHMPFLDAANALWRAMDEAMLTLEIPREGFDLAIFPFEHEGDPHLCVAMLPYRVAMAHDVARRGGDAHVDRAV